MPLNWLRKLATKRKSETPIDATALALSEAIRGRCPRCQKDLHNHAFQMFALTIGSIEKKEVMSDFILRARNQDWESLAKFQSFDPLQNVLEVHALRCEDNRLNLLLVRNPFELFDSHSIEDWEALDENESTKWSAHLADENWISFAPGAKGAA